MDATSTSELAAAADEVDAVVLGMGSGGESVATLLARAGCSVVGIEAGLVGGECPFWACVPSKMMLRAAHLLADARRIPHLAGSATVTADWSPVATRIREEATDHWDDTDAVERFEEAGGRLVRGRGRLLANDLVEVTTETGTHHFRAARAVVVATGSAPAVPPIDGLADTPFWTNHEATETETLPESIVVLGGGPVGVELAQVFTRFGAAVTVVEAADRLLPQEEPEAGELLAGALAEDGAETLTGVSARHVSHDGDRFTVRLDDGRTVQAERLLVATGRRVDLGAIGADAIGVDSEQRFLPVDAHLRVTDGVWAVGDVTGKGAFTHVAVHQARIAAADILGEPHTPFEDRAVPRVTFTDPEVGSVGRSESAARDDGIEVAVGLADVPKTTRGWLHGPGNRGVIKLVADRKAGVLVGAMAAGPHGGEVLGLLALAVHARTPLSELRSMIYAYPTFHRGIGDAVRDLE